MSGLREGGPIGIAIAMIVFVFLVLLPFVVVPAVYAFITVYAITKGSTFGSGSVNEAVVLGGIALLTAALLLAMFGGIALIGKALERG